MARGAEAVEVRLSSGPSGLSLDVSAVGDRPAWPDEPGDGIRRWVTRMELMGGTVLLQPASAHLRFGSADGETCVAAWRRARWEDEVTTVFDLRRSPHRP